MSPNPQFPVDLVIFTKEIPNGKLHILCRVSLTKTLMGLFLIRQFSCYLIIFHLHFSNKLKYEPQTLLLDSITFVGIPTFNSGTCGKFLVVKFR